MTAAWLQIYDVLKPNKNFSKAKADAPRITVCLASGSMLPYCSQIQQLQQIAAPLPLYFARVSGGEVSFHSLSMQA